MSTQRLLIIIIAFFLSVAGFSYYLFVNVFESGQASPQPILNSAALSPDSSVTQTQSATILNLYTNQENGAIYQTKDDDIEGVVRFLDDSPIAVNVKGATTQKPVLPEKLLRPENYSLVRRVDDQNDRYLKRKNIHSKASHYLLQQRIKGLPIVFSNLGVHQVDNKIQAVFGTVVNDETVPQKKLTLNQAESAVTALLEKESVTTGGLSFTSKEVIYNGAVTGLNPTDSNHIAADIKVVSPNDPLQVNRQYIVDLQTAYILFEQNLVREAMRREIYNCKISSSCPLVRDDVSKTAPTGDREADLSYDILGDVYDYYFDTYGRDSFDGRGHKMLGTVHFPHPDCPNAFYGAGEMAACDGVVAADVWGHEFTHGVTDTTAGLIYIDQSGALNESISDIFATALDPDWEIGEELHVPPLPNPLRSMSNPPLRDDPDKLFSSLYYCGTVQKIAVHTNSGILNKAFYLMSDGGTFNDCSIRGIGKEKAHAVIYQALTKSGYLTSTSNFKDAYNVIVRACTDLAQASGSFISADDCTQVRRSLQAVEMDLQPAGTQRHPSCPNPAVRPASYPQQASCAGQAPEPSPTPPGQSPTGGALPTPTATTVPVTTPPADGVPTPTPTAVSGATATPTPTSSGGSSTISLTLDLKFQGIYSRPSRTQTMNVSVALSGKSQPAPVFQRADFTASEQGLWRGTVTFNKPKGEYCILVKGPYHMQKRICDRTAQEDYPGSYRAPDNRFINLETESSSLDFSKVLLLVGDLPTQDGVVNSVDIAKCRSNINESDNQSLVESDVDLNGAVNAQDCALMIAALSFKFDEE